MSAATTEPTDPDHTDPDHTEPDHTDPDHTEPDHIEIPAAAVVLELDPAHVAQHPDNLRDPGRGIPELTASVAEVGVLVPLIVVPVALVPGHQFDPEITHVAVDGNRRQAAARAAGLPLPCIVRADLAAAKATARTMAVTGLVRDDLTPAEEAHAVATLFDLKYSGAAISRATGRSKTRLAAARTAATLTGPAAHAAADYPLTIDQLAVLAQWQHDPAAVARLLDGAARGRLDHIAAQLSAEHRERQAIAGRTAELAALGVAVVDAEPRSYDHGPARPLHALRPSPQSPTGTELTAADHAGCPGHAAYVTADYDEIDPDEENPAQPNPELEVTVTYLCTDPDRYGHWPRYRPAAPGQPADPTGQDDSDLDRRACAEETRRAERRELIRLNKEADAAQQVRREFLRQCLTVKSRHQAMAGWALAQVIQRDPTYSRWAAEYYRDTPVLAEILGENPRAAAAAAPPARRGVILWAHLCCANEEDLPRDAHRDTSPRRAAYLTHLQTIGYHVSDVEQRILTNAAAADPARDAADDGQPAGPDGPAGDREAVTAG